MTDERVPAPFRLAPRPLVQPDDGLAGDILSGGAASALLRGLVGSAPVSPVCRRGRLDPEAFTTSSDSARAKLNIILEGGGQFVSTGQQPGLFLGPLYTLYKAASAIKLAADLEQATGRPMLAVFWVAADDHDWDEIGACRVVTAEETLSDYRFSAPAGRERRSVGETVLPDWIEAEHDRLTAELGIGPGGDDRSAHLEPLRGAYRPGVQMSEAFSAAMARLFGAVDLALLDSSRPEVRRVAAGFYADVVTRASDVVGAMAAGKAGVEQAGYAVPLRPPESGLQVFYDSGDAREHVLTSADGFRISAGKQWSDEELQDHLVRNPCAFTPAAALRPVLESWLLPVAASVLGPGELAYWAQLRPLFQAFDVEMPLAAGRDSWFLLEARVDRLLRKLDVDPLVVERGAAELRRRVLAAARPEGVKTSMADLRNEVRARLDELAATADRELPGLRSATGKTLHAVERALDELGRLVDRQVAERESTSLDQARRLTVHLAPGGVAQERGLGAIGYLASYGSRLIDELVGSDSRYVAGMQGQD